MAYQRVTRAELRAALTVRWEGVPFWTTDEANFALNEALRVWNLVTGIWRRRIVIATAAADRWITLPSTLVIGARITYNERPLLPASLASLDQFQPAWESETTASGGAVPTTVQRWAPAGLTLIALWPADATGGGSLVVDGVRQTPILTLDAAFVDVSEGDLRAILGYALHIATFKEIARFAATQHYLQEFFAAAIAKVPQLRQVQSLTDAAERADRISRPAVAPALAREGAA